MSRYNDDNGYFPTSKFGLKAAADYTKKILTAVPESHVASTTATLTMPDASGQIITDTARGETRSRIGLVEVFTRAPQLSAVTQLPAGDTYNTANLLANLNANRLFEVLGVNAVSADVAQYVEGGISVATHGATNDSTIILPHLTATQSPWTKITWGTDQQVEWEINFQTPAAITACEIWAGLKKTNTPVVTTDTDQAFFKYDSAHSTSPTLWHTIYSISNTDTEAGVGSAVAAATNYTLSIKIDSSRVARFYINGAKVTTSSALANAVDLIPYFGILDTSAGSARTAYLFSQKISRKTGA